MYVNVFDSHTHSNNSGDGKHSVLYLGETAEQKEMMGFCVTDHYECAKPGGQFEIRIRNSVIETGKARVSFDSRLLITSGVEIGQATRDFAEAERLLSQHRFDFVIGSLHSDSAMDDYCYLDFTSLNVDMILDRYYDEMLELCRWNRFDVLGHLTYPLRYITGKFHIRVDMHRYDEVIREIFDTLIKAGRGIEINTSGLRQGLGETMPALKYAKMYKDCGGEIITIGSDAHCKQDLGANIQDGMALLEEAGFKYFAFFKHREPRMLKLI